jgi:hypothetical protein
MFDGLPQLDQFRPRRVTPLSMLSQHGWQSRGFSLRENALVRGANGHVQREPTPIILNGVTRRADDANLLGAKPCGRFAALLRGR